MNRTLSGRDPPLPSLKRSQSTTTRLWTSSKTNKCAKLVTDMLDIPFLSNTCGCTVLSGPAPRCEHHFLCLSMGLFELLLYRAVNQPTRFFLSERYIYFICRIGCYKRSDQEGKTWDSLGMSLCAPEGATQHVKTSNRTLPLLSIVMFYSMESITSSGCFHTLSSGSLGSKCEHTWLFNVVQNHPGVFFSIGFLTVIHF